MARVFIGSFGLGEQVTRAGGVEGVEVSKLS